jgi:hypothetical protein
MDQDFQASELLCALELVRAAPTAVLLLDADVTVLAASTPFLDAFVDSPNAEGRNFFELDAGKWNVPAMRRVVQQTSSGATLEGRAEIDTARANAKPHCLEITARRVGRTTGARSSLLLAVIDNTEERAWKRERATLQQEKSLLVMQVQRQNALRETLCQKLGISIDCTDCELALHVLPDETANQEASLGLGLIVTDLVMRTLAQSYPDLRPTVVSLHDELNTPGWSIKLRNLVAIDRQQAADILTDHENDAGHARRAVS